jgi:hypothetical protein
MTPQVHMTPPALHGLPAYATPAGRRAALTRTLRTEGLGALNDEEFQRTERALTAGWFASVAVAMTFFGLVAYVARA